MKKFILSLFIFSSYSFSYDLDSIPQDRPVHTAYVLNLNHHFYLTTAFRALNTGLCLISKDNHEEWVNLNIYQNPETKDMPEDFNENDYGDEIYRGYMTQINDRECSANESGINELVKVRQASETSPLLIEHWKQGSWSDFRLKAEVIEETTDANPFGVINFSRNLSYRTEPGSMTSDTANIYLATAKSARIDENTIEYNSITWNDQNVLAPESIPIGVSSEGYFAKIIHTEGAGGYGTSRSMSWSLMSGTSFGNFPDGIPQVYGVVNFSYDDTYLLFQRYLAFGNGSVESYNPPWQEFDLESVCINRTTSWKYVFHQGYGVFDSDGYFISQDLISVPYSTNIEGYGVWSGNLLLTKDTINGIPYYCKNLSDGSLVIPLTQDCAGHQAAHANQTEQMKLFEIPDGTVLVDDSGNEYYVRVLRPRRVYSHEPLENCSNLSIEATQETKDHTFFEYLDTLMPPKGAVIYGGNSYIPYEDDDGDGFLNIFDAFPEDPLKNTDVDHDGIDDSEDSEILQFIPAYKKYLDKNLFFHNP